MCGNCKAAKSIPKVIMRPREDEFENVVDEEEDNMRKLVANSDEAMSPLTFMRKTGKRLQDYVAAARANQVAEEDAAVEDAVVDVEPEEENEDATPEIVVVEPVDAKVGAKTTMRVKGKPTENGVYSSDAWPGLRLLVIRVTATTRNHTDGESTVIAILRPLSPSMTRIDSVHLKKGHRLSAGNMPAFTLDDHFPMPEHARRHPRHRRREQHARAQLNQEVEAADKVIERAVAQPKHTTAIIPTVHGRREIRRARRQTRILERRSLARG
jgi:hypothetical protein